MYNVKLYTEVVISLFPQLYNRFRNIPLISRSFDFHFFKLENQKIKRKGGVGVCVPLDFFFFLKIRLDSMCFDLNPPTLHNSVSFWTLRVAETSLLTPLHHNYTSVLSVLWLNKLCSQDEVFLTRRRRPLPPVNTEKGRCFNMICGSQWNWWQ